MPLYIKVSEEECIGCGECVEVCPATPCVFELDGILAVAAHPEVCERCMMCIENCPTNAISFSDSEDVFLDIGDI